MAKESVVKNKRGILAWINPHNYNIERWAYTFQRLTGLGILAYLIGHIGDTSFFVGGPFGIGPNKAAYSDALTLTENFIGHLILVIVVLMIVFHGINGIRLILAELGIIVGKPSRIEYPYKARSLSTIQRHMIWAAIILAVIAAFWSGSILFGGK